MGSVKIVDPGTITIKKSAVFLLPWFQRPLPDPDRPKQNREPGCSVISVETIKFRLMLCGRPCLQRGNCQMKGSQPFWVRVAVFCRSFARIGGEAFRRYGRIDGEQCAASFAYYAFFSSFLLILLLVVMGTFFIPDRLQAAGQVVKQVEEYLPLQAKDKAILIETVDNAIENGWRAGIFGAFALTWSALRFFQALVIGVNRAWGFKDY
jgi:hypothetical protein